MPEMQRRRLHRHIGKSLGAADRRRQRFDSATSPLPCKGRPFQEMSKSQRRCNHLQYHYTLSRVLLWVPRTRGRMKYTNPLKISLGIATLAGLTYAASFLNSDMVMAGVIGCVLVSSVYHVVSGAVEGICEAWRDRKRDSSPAPGIP